MFPSGISLILLLLPAYLPAQPVYHPCKEYNQGQYCNQNKNNGIAANAALMANNSRSDTIDILNYTINLDITDFTNKKIKGDCEILFTPKFNNINYIALDLLKLTIDSIKLNGSKLTWSYDDTLIVAWFALPLNTGDTETITVYYRGTPQMDGGGSGWGGFYFQGAYAYNLGVGFFADPHVYGRVWFPCFDNFVEHSTYTCKIKTAGGKKAVCGGMLINETAMGGDTVIRSWRLNQEIPTYLASVAVGPYVFINQSFNGINGTIPVILAAAATDTAKVKNSFVNLINALTAFENGYGPYRWDRVGYAFVPFNSGAMEHATNIAFPSSFANGSLTYETTMAHELSHHWWGDLITCETAGDMWINEGCATYSEFLFEEYVYGKTKYAQEVAANHEYVVRYTHIYNGGYYPLSPVSHDMTYDSDLIYLKGGDVAHTLRGYMGDSLFFNCIKSMMNAYTFKNINSYQMRDFLSNCSGIDLTPFFDSWVFSPGFPHFSIDSVQTQYNGPGNYSSTVFMKQKLTGAPSYYTNVPLAITFFDTGWNQYSAIKLFSGPLSSAVFSLSVNPILSLVDYQEKISDAITSDSKIIKTTGNYTLGNPSVSALKWVINIQSISDSMFIRSEHNWTAPDPPDVPTVFRLNPYRYWKISGIFPSAYSANAQIFYNGTTSSYLDWKMFLDTTATDDSLVLLYRKNAGYPWNVFPYCTKFIINANGHIGRFDIDSLLPGEYVFAIKGDTIWTNSGTNKSFSNQFNVTVIPNPFSSAAIFIIPAEIITGKSNLFIYDTDGRCVAIIPITSPVIQLHRDRFTAGLFFYRLIQNGKPVAAGKFIIE